MISLEESIRVLKNVDSRILKNTKGCLGTAAILKDGKMRMHIFLKELTYNSEGKCIQDHLLNLRFNRDGARLIKDTIETKHDDLIPHISVGGFKFLYDRAAKWRPAPGSVSIGHADLDWTTAGTFGVIVYKQINCDYIIEGSGLSPDCGGCYKIHGMYNNRPCYKHKDNDWYLWFQDGVPVKFAVEVTGDILPAEAKGIYRIFMIETLQNPYYKHISEDYYLWWFYYDNNWYITNEAGFNARDPRALGSESWKRVESGGIWPYMEGDYEADYNTTGTAIVTLLPNYQPPGWFNWVITNILGDTSQYCWRGDETIEGLYNPYQGVSGNALVSKPNDKCRRYILSNNHILADLNYGQLGDAIVQPGMYDIFEHSPPYSEEELEQAVENNKIGELEDFVTLIDNTEEPPYNYVDTAICKPIDYWVSGDLSPDCGGGYEEAVGTYNGKAVYYRSNAPYVLWWDKDSKRWVITDDLGDMSEVCWKRRGKEIEGDYEPILGTSGIANVKIGVLDGILDLQGLTSTVKCPEVNEETVKIGRTSGRTEGKIIGITGIVDIYAAEDWWYRFDKQLVIDALVEGGDSGSLVISKCGKRAEGLVFAGNENLQIGLCNIAICVEKLLNVRFARPRRVCIKTTVQKIIGKTVDGVRKLCRLCKCAINMAFFKCVFPALAYVLISDDPYDGCIATGGSLRAECGNPAPYDVCEDESCGPNPPNETSDCPLWVVTDCVWSSGVCFWLWDSKSEPDYSWPRCTLFQWQDASCYCYYSYVDDTCSGIGGHLCGD